MGVINVRPTFLGQIFAALFKPPQLHVLFRFEDGHTETYRYIAAMGRSGFIISPVIHDATDFAALLTQDREQYFSSVSPTSVEVKGDAGTDLLWKRGFEVQLRRIEVPVQAGAEKFVYDQLANDQGISDLTVNRKIAGSGECWIDTINRKPLTTQPIELKGRLLVQGWAALSAQRGIAADEVLITLASNGDSLMRAVRARVVPRPDVGAFFKHPEMGPVGFEASIDPAVFKGRSKLQIYLKRHDQFFSCQPVVKITN